MSDAEIYVMSMFPTESSIKLKTLIAETSRQEKQNERTDDEALRGAPTRCQNGFFILML